MFLLPEIKKGKNIDFNYFPTKIQAVIFRCWETIPCCKIAEVLKTTPENIRKMAFDMGLGEQKYTDDWMTKGYITIIKSMWHLLPYSQLLELLGWSEERLAYILKDDDFLDIKLGCFKPDCEKVTYRELTPLEIELTENLKKSIISCGIDFDNESEVAPFDFFHNKYGKLYQNSDLDVIITDEWSIENYTDNNDVKVFTKDFKDELNKSFGITFSEKSHISIRLYIDTSISTDDEYHEIYISKNGIDIKAVSPVGIMRSFYYLLELVNTRQKCTFKAKTYKRTPNLKTRYIYSFCGLYSDALDVDGEISFPEQLLKEYAKRGINGVWIQAVLYKITEFPFDKSVSVGWEKRLKNLKTLVKRASRYGIKIYLYINEPRFMPKDFFDKYPHIKGNEYSDGNACMCTLTKEVQEYLKNSLQTVVKNVPDIGGFFAITMSENRTNCYSEYGKSDLPVNCPRCGKAPPSTVIAKTIDIMAKAVYEINPKIKFFAWDWSWSLALKENDIRTVFENIPKSVIIQCTSEHKLDFEIAGVKNKVNDYTLSMAGPSNWTKTVWKLAKETGHECPAKVQINNSWECSTAPFLPVYDTLLKHMSNLTEEKVQHIMLSWTLGGYPSDNISIASSFFFTDIADSSPDIYDTVLRNSYGEYADKVKKAASHFSKAFACFPFDIDTLYFGPQNSGVSNLLFESPTEFESSMTCYPYDDIKRWRSIYSEKTFANQLDKLCKEWEKGLETINDMPVCEFCDMAFYGYSLFKSSYNQFIYYSDHDCNKASIICDEKSMAISNYKIMQRNSAIGYEAANHYYITKTMLLEKIIQCDYLLTKRSEL